MGDGSALWAAWSRGDSDAGRRLVERHYPTLERFFGNKIGEPATELIARTFRRARDDVARRDDAHGVVPLLRTARALLVAHFEWIIGSATQLDPTTRCAAELLPSSSDAIASTPAQRLRRGLRHIPLEQQTALELMFWENLELSQIARVIGKTDAQTRAVLDQAEQALARQLAAPTSGPSDQGSAPTLEAEADLSPTMLSAEPRPPPSDAEAPEGQRLGPYTLVRRLGAGGMGEVFEARHRDTGEHVALKQLSRVDATRLYRFKREFRALVGVSHPNLVRLGELVVPAEGHAFFTMELLAGAPFVGYVRAGIPRGQPPEPTRLLHALRQLVRGVMCMHEAGCVHRDLKPSNVLVTRKRRVVILDFGLVAEPDETTRGMTRDGQVLGTPAYMAPEQAGPDAKGLAIDYYALGVILYECLTGTLPFDGSPLQILLDKQQHDAPDPEQRVAGLPPPLRQLCIDLLRRDPERRPTGAQLLARLSGSDPATLDPPRGSGSRREAATFVGRDRELEELSRARSDVRSRAQAVTVHVRGASGLGKTALLVEFGRRVHERADDEVVILRGRCFERESVPYKGVDAVIDALAAWLRRRPADEQERLRPAHLPALVRIFPVLDAVWQSDRIASPPEAPHELRRLGLLALRAVLTRLAEGRTLIVQVDDFQWADEDGARLLGALVRSPEPPPLLLLVSFRDEVEQHASLQTLTSRQEQLGRDVRELRLPPLSAEEARRLAQRLVEVHHPRLPAGRKHPVAAHVERARGNPFFIGQLVRGEQLAADEDSSLDHVVSRRIAGLDEQTRRVLAIVTVAGGPIEGPIVQAALGSPRCGTLVDQLCQQELLVRRTTTSGEHSLETAHDRIREVMLVELSASQRRDLHRALADAIEQAQGDPQQLAEHLMRGGAEARALTHVERAAAQASEALAFGRAATLYRQALELLGERDVDGEALARRQHLRHGLARQLVALGQCEAAGDLLQSLAREAPDRQALDYRAEAAAQLIHVGRTREGIELATTVLRAIGEPPPAGTWRTLLRFAWERLRIWIRGSDSRPRAEADIPAAQLERFDLIWKLTIGFSTKQLLHAQILYARLLRLGLELGEPRRLAIPLTYEITIAPLLGLHARARRLEAQVRAIVEQTGDLDTDQRLHFALGLTHISAGRLTEAADELGALGERLDVEPAPHWLRAITTSVYTATCVQIGRWREVEIRMPQWLITARERGNPMEIAELEATAAAAHAYLGHHERAREHLEAARMVPLSEHYSITHYLVDSCDALVLLAEGSMARALEVVETLQERARRLNFVVAFATQRVWGSLLARCHLGLAMQAPADPARRRAVRKILRRQRGSDIPVLRAEALIGEAALRSLAGDEATAHRCWCEAEALCIEHRLDAHLAAVRWRLGHQGDDQPARERRALAEAHARAQRWSDPERIFDMLAPAHRHRSTRAFAEGRPGERARSSIPGDPDHLG